MNFNITEATSSLQQMITGFIERLPYMVLALVVFVLFLVLAIAVRSTVRALAARAHSRRNFGLVLGRLVPARRRTPQPTKAQQRKASTSQRPRRSAATRARQRLRRSPTSTGGRRA